ncbi:MAG: hypothetical protein ACI4NM_11800 [Bullifex sp.]
MRKTAKALLFCILILIVTAAMLTGLFFMRTEVNAVVSMEEKDFLSGSLRTPVLSPYRITISVYPEVKEGVRHLYSPLAALQAEEAESVAEGSACWGIAHSAEFELSFVPDRSGRWLAAVDADRKLNIAFVYNTENSAERAAAELMPPSVVLIPYDGFVSFVSAGEMRKTLDEKKVGTIIIPDPSSAVSLLEVTGDLSLVVSTYYRDAIETSSPAFAVTEDFDSMIRALISGEKGEKETPYVLSPCKKGFEVVSDKLGKIFN